jgi:hypothetical protein
MGWDALLQVFTELDASLSIYREATVLVDITFQEGERIDLFIGWQNKRDEFYG